MQKCRPRPRMTSVCVAASASAAPIAACSASTDAAESALAFSGRSSQSRGHPAAHAIEARTVAERSQRLGTIVPE